MDFLGDPEATAVREYVEALEAAPELTVDMEPVAWDVYVEEHSNGYFVDSLDDAQWVDDATNHNAVATPLYSATQLATLQAENERLTEERDELLPVLRLAGAYLVTGTKIDNDVRALLAKHEGEKHD
jgi:hypothetical protein